MDVIMEQPGPEGLSRIYPALPRASLVLPPAPARGPIVTPVDWSAGDRLIAQCFWTSTDKDANAWTCPESEVRRVITFGLKAEPVPHGTPFGHGHLTIHVDRLPLPIAGQMIRHRVQEQSQDGSIPIAAGDWLPNISQKSYRYVTAEGELNEVMWVPEPSELRHQVGRPGRYTYEPLSQDVAEHLVARMREQAGMSWDLYQDLILEGLAPEQARMWLPQATFTRLYATASYRNWLTWLTQRNDSHAQEEVQQVARQVEAIVAQCIPITHGVWESYGRRPM